MLRSALLLCLSLLAVSVLTNPAAAQEFYRWKDKNGVTHYTRTPPPEGAETERVVVTPPKSSDSAAPAASQAGAQAPAGGPVAEQRSAACIAAQANLDTLQSNPFVSMDKDGDGKAELLSVEEHNAELNRARHQARLLCPSTPNPEG